MRPKTKDNFVVAVLLIIAIAHVLDIVIMMPLGPKLMRSMDLSASEFGYIVSAYAIAAAVSSLYSSTWIDKFNRKHALICLLIGFLFGNALCAYAPSPVILFLGRIVAGLFGGVINASVYSFVGQAISIDRQGRASGLIGVAFPLVSVLGVPLGLKLTDFGTWRNAFYMVIAMSFVALCLAAISLPSLKPEVHDENHKHSVWNNLKLVWSHSPHRVALLVMVLTVLGGFTVVPYIAPFLIGNGYLIETNLYLVYLVGGAGAVISSQTIGHLADRFGRITILRFMLIFACLTLVFFTNLPYKNISIVILTTTVMMMVLPGRFVCVMAWINVIANPKTRGIVMSFISTTQQLAIGLATIVGGYLVGESNDGSLATYWMAGLFAVGANLIAFLLSPYLRRLEKRAGS